MCPTGRKLCEPCTPAPALGGHLPDCNGRAGGFCANHLQRCGGLSTLPPPGPTEMARADPQEVWDGWNRKAPLKTGRVVATEGQYHPRNCCTHRCLPRALLPLVGLPR